MTVHTYQNLLKHLANIDDITEIDNLLKALLTQKERLDISNRIRIFDLLDQGVTQRDIANQLGVGVATVSRGAKAMHKHNVNDLLVAQRRLLKNKVSS